MTTIEDEQIIELINRAKSLTETWDMYDSVNEAYIKQLQSQLGIALTSLKEIVGVPEEDREKIYNATIIGMYDIAEEAIRQIEELSNGKR